MPRTVFFLVSSMGSGGAERTAAFLCNAWAARGDSVTLVETFSGTTDCFYSLSPLINHIRLGVEYPLRAQDGAARIRRLLRLRRLISSTKPDAIVSFLTNVNVAAILAAAGSGVPTIVSERSFPPAERTSWTWRAARKLTYPFANALVVLSKEAHAWATENLGLTSAHVIPNPVSYPLAALSPKVDPELYLPDERSLIVAVGRIDGGKQFDKLVRAFHSISSIHSNWALAIVGDGPNRPELVKLVENLGLSGKVVMPGRVGNVGDWYRRAKVFAMTSRYEGFPNCLVEAMSYGLCPVSFDCDTGPRSIISHRINGLLVDPSHDWQGIGSALDEVLSNDSLRSRLSDSARQVRTTYSEAAVLERWDAIFRNVGASS